MGEGSQSREQSALSDAINDQVEEWSTNSNDVFQISLYRGNDAIATFNPAFTYPIFGEEEAIFGYRGLSIDLAFAAHNLKPDLKISWDEQFKQVGEIKASDIRGALDDFVPSSAFSEEPRSKVLADSSAATFTPPGSLLHSYQIDGETFELWTASLADPAAKQLLENAQILVPLLIEGGTILQLDQTWVTERWKVFLLYQRHVKTAKTSQANTSPYVLVGYATSYRVFTLPDRSNPSLDDLKLLGHGTVDMDAVLNRPSSDSPDFLDHGLKTSLELPSRERISQFLILPPFQGSGHGARLYGFVYGHLIKAANVCEITVEDPNEVFDDMRDVCDMVHLRQHNDDFASLAINPMVDASFLKPPSCIPVDSIVESAAKHRIGTASKIMPRQLARLIEMQTLSKIPHLHRSTKRLSRKEKSSNELDRAYYFWRLYVKQRLFISNRDSLKQLDREDRIEKLEHTVDNVKADYERLLEIVDKRSRLVASDDNVPVHDGQRRGQKRKLVVEDEDDDDDEDDTEVGVQSDEKKQKTAA